MRFPPSILEEIRARLPVSVVVGRRVKLQKAGREWKGLSPFNQERTPSFYVNDHKGFYHCFSSGKHGDIFSFLIETEGVSFPEAVERLAAEAGVTLPKLTAEAVEREEERRGLHDIMELAASFFEAALRTPAGQGARRYLEGRDLEGPTRTAFRLGYALPDRFALRDHLAEKGVSAEQMIACGLLIHGDDIAVPYDRFRDRVMFPIADPKGRIIAFGGRALQADVPAKYLNSPDTVLFQKGQILYNHHNARKAAHERQSVIAVEGYVDVIAMTRAGLHHTVAPLGTALTPEQLQLLWRMAAEPILCFDGDKAGRRAAHRAIDVALPLLSPGRSLRFVFLPEGQDPDDLLRSAGADAVRAAVEATEPLADVLWAREVERQPLDTPERRADLERRMRELVNGIGDETLRKHYFSDAMERVRQLLRPAPALRDAGAYRTERSSGQRGGRAPFLTGPPAGERAKARQAAQTVGASLRESRIFKGGGGPPSREAALVLACVHHPALLDRHDELLASLILSHGDTRRLRTAILDAHAAADQRDFGDSFASGLFAPLLDRVQNAVNPSDFWALPGADADDVIRGWLDAVSLHEKSSTLHMALKEAEADHARTGTEETFARLRAIATRRESDDADVDSDAFGKFRRRERS
jgi:DNA primase